MPLPLLDCNVVPGRFVLAFMTTRQFGFVVARGLAILAWMFALNDLKVYFSIFLGAGMIPRPWGMLGVGGFIFVVELLLGTFLWTCADRFAGPSADTVAPPGGDWVARLVFQALGILLMVFALASSFPYLSTLIFSQGQTSIQAYSPLVGYVIQFLIGLGLCLFNRFKRPAY